MTYLQLWLQQDITKIVLNESTVWRKATPTWFLLQLFLQLVLLFPSCPAIYCFPKVRWNCSVWKGLLSPPKLPQSPSRRAANRCSASPVGRAVCWPLWCSEYSSADWNVCLCVSVLISLSSGMPNHSASIQVWHVSCSALSSQMWWENELVFLC